MSRRRRCRTAPSALSGLHRRFDGAGEGGPVVPIHGDAPAVRLGGFGAECFGFLQFMNFGVDGFVVGPYTRFIDGGAACERAAGFGASGLRFGGHRPAGFAGCVVVFPGFGAVAPGWTYGSASGRPSLFDNFIGRKRNVDGGVLAAWLWPGTALRCCERTAPTVTFPDSSRFGSGFRVGSGTDVFGTRRDVWAEAWTATVISRDQVLSYNLRV